MAALKQMQRRCKPDGVVLLLEHGRPSSRGTWLGSTFDAWLAGVLDQGARAHAKKWGCVWNRDIERIVEQSGLVVDELEVYNFGTTYMVVGRPDPALAGENVSAVW